MEVLPLVLHWVVRGETFVQSGAACATGENRTAADSAKAVSGGAKNGDDVLMIRSDR